MVEKLTREELEKVALEKAPAALNSDLADTLEETSDEALQAIINGNLFFTNDGYLLMKHTLEGKDVWTNFDFSFPDIDGMPFHDLDDNFLEGRFVLSNQGTNVSNQYEAIMGSKHEFETNPLTSLTSHIPDMRGNAC